MINDHQPDPRFATPDVVKQHIVSLVREILASKFTPGQLVRACHQTAHVFCMVANKLGFRAVMQSGDASWFCGEQAVFDGDRFGYQFVQKPDPKDCEFHVWAALPDRGEIVDLTTCYWPDQMHRILGGRWQEDTYPPDFLWCQVNDTPFTSGVASYTATREATVWAHSMIGADISKMVFSSVG